MPKIKGIRMSKQEEKHLHGFYFYSNNILQIDSSYVYRSRKMYVLPTIALMFPFYFIVSLVMFNHMQVCLLDGMHRQ